LNSNEDIEEIAEKVVEIAKQVVTKEITIDQFHHYKIWME
jgi:hypothetical protein